MTRKRLRHRKRQNQIKIIALPPPSTDLKQIMERLMNMAQQQLGFPLGRYCVTMNVQYEDNKNTNS